MAVWSAAIGIGVSNTIVTFEKVGPTSNTVVGTSGFVGLTGTSLAVGISVSGSVVFTVNSVNEVYALYNISSSTITVDLVSNSTYKFATTISRINIA